MRPILKYIKCTCLYKKREEEGSKWAPLFGPFKDTDNNVVVVLGETKVFGKAVKVLNGFEDMG